MREQTFGPTSTPWVSPFKADTPFGMLRQHTDVQPPRVRQLRPDVPQAVDNAVQRCLEKDPARRYQTPAELVQAIGKRMPEKVSPPSRQSATVAPPARPLDTWMEAWAKAWRKANRSRLAWIGTVLNLGVGGTLTLVWFGAFDGLVDQPTGTESTVSASDGGALGGSAIATLPDGPSF